MTDKGLSELIAATIAIAIIAMVIGTVKGLYDRAQPTCEEVRTKMWAHQQCLKMRPSCMVSQQSFIDYERHEEWMHRNCPVEDWL